LDCVSFIRNNEPDWCWIGHEFTDIAGTYNWIDNNFRELGYCSADEREWENRAYLEVEFYKSVEVQKMDFQVASRKARFVRKAITGRFVLPIIDELRPNQTFLESGQHIITDAADPETRRKRKAHKRTESIAPSMFADMISAVVCGNAREDSPRNKLPPSIAS
jgi:hypothetical protein